MFFVSPTNSDEHPRVLNVQKVQLLLAIMGGEALLRELDALVARAGFVRPTQPAHPVLYRYDTAADRQVKQLLNYDLPYEIADDVLRTLFTRHVGDEKEMAQELYLTLDMIREMSSAGMVFGFHTRHHRVLSRLSVRAQRAEIDGGVQWIRDLTGQRAVPFCYPHGHAHVYTTETVDIVRAAGYAMAFTAVRGPATFGTHSWFEIPRYDTRDLDAALGVQHPAASVAHASADGAFSRA
jgi:hypothetical protein